MSLDKQVYVYSLGTECFYTDKEHDLHNRMLKCHVLKKKNKPKVDEVRLNIKKINSTLKDIRDSKLSKDEVPSLLIERKALQNRGRVLRNRNKIINQTIQKSKELIVDSFKKFNGIRTLRNDTLTDNKKVGMFDSVLTRTLGIKANAVSSDLFIVRAFYFNVLEDIINSGFTYNNEKYIYLSSSAGQIRTKKTVFIKESLWNKYELSLTCGLTTEMINAKGGCNVNKLLAYKALVSSASQKWYGFDINRTVVVPDLSSPVTALFDNIDRDTYEITRKEINVDIEHTDGCGMILPSKSKRTFMTRLPFIKGLLVPFSFDKFAMECDNTKIIDIYGKEWDIIEDKIEVIFTKSQFKMAKYYDDWDDYKNKFNEHNCQANKLNEEELGVNATLNYQMLQTLTDISEKELKELSKETIEDIRKITSDKDTMLRILGATKENKKKSYFQTALVIYPEMLNDSYSKSIIRSKRDSLVNDARAGKININGRYIYIIPDLYAFCEKLFKGIVSPKGILKNNDVYCSVYEVGEVDILRSPHLYKEHAIRNIVKSDELDKWFITQGIYTSIHDPISRILQFDNDGDKVLTIQDELLIEIARRNMKDVYPLYYEMGVAEAQIISNDKIYESLISAFKANIGEVSNNITKIFNSSDGIDMEVVKWLTAENNYIIDFAKTLFMPTRPPNVDERIRKAISGKVPHFFREAKGKEIKNVEPINNSTVNKLRKIIKNPPIKFKEIKGGFDYKMLMSEEIDYTNNKIVNKYKELNRKKKYYIREAKIKDRKEGMLFIHKKIKDELSKIEPNEQKVVNILVNYLYNVNNSPNKDSLWNCYGEILLSNLRENLKGTKQCECCGVRVEVVNNQSKYCDNCFKQERKKYKAQKEKEYRLKKRGQLDAL